jgi:hypothetical protein
MFAGNVNQEIGFGATAVFATGATHIRFSRCVGLGQVLGQAAFLDEAFAAALVWTNMIQGSGMFLHMVKHGIGAVFGFTAFATDIESGFVSFTGRGNNRCHRCLVVLRPWARCQFL